MSGSGVLSTGYGSFDVSNFDSLTVSDAPPISVYEGRACQIAGALAPAAVAGVAWATTAGFNKQAGLTLSNGNLNVSQDLGGGGNFAFIRSSAPAGVTSGSFSTTLSNATPGQLGIGVNDGSQDFTNVDPLMPGRDDNKGVTLQTFLGNFYISMDGGNVQGPLTPTSLGNSVIRCDFDTVAKTVKFYEDGVQIGTTVTLTTSTYANWYAHYGAQNNGAFNDIINTDFSAFGGSGVSTITAVASPTLGTFLSASAAKALVEGLGSGTLNAFSTSGVAKVRIKGSASVSLSPFSSAATAAVRVKAVASPSLGTFLSAAAAKILVEGAGSGILSAFGTTSTAKVRVKAAASISPNPFNTTATAHVVSSGITATVSVSLSPFTSAAAAKGLIEGVGGGTLNAFASTSSAKIRIKAAASLQLGAFTAAVSAKVRLRASAAVALSPFTASGTVVPITPASVPDNRTTHAPARVSNSVAPSGLRTTYAPRKAA